MMQAQPSPTDSRSKVNPSVNSVADGGCGKPAQCPYKDKPAQMRAANFTPDDSARLISINDNACSVCGQNIVDCEKIPPPPPIPRWPWVVLANVLLGAALWWWWPNQEQKKVIDHRDTTRITRPGNPTATPPSKTAVDSDKLQKGDKVVVHPVHPPDGPTAPIRDFRDGKCKIYYYKNGRIISTKILDSSQCN